jgi:carboxylesterase type B
MALVFCTLAVLSLASATSPVVKLGYANYEGRSLSSGVSQWLGIRFAAPPVGERRFAAPQDPVSVAGIQQATEVYMDCI